MKSKVRLTPEQKAELYRRFYDYQNGIGKTYKWEETLAMAKQALSARKINPVDLTDEQILMLQLSNQDIAAGRLITQQQADKDDLDWLKDF